MPREQQQAGPTKGTAPASSRAPSKAGKTSLIKLPDAVPLWHGRYDGEPQRLPPSFKRGYIGHVPNVVLEFARVLDGDEFKILLYVVRWTYGGPPRKVKDDGSGDDEKALSNRPVGVSVTANELGRWIGRSDDVVRDRLRKLHAADLLRVSHMPHPEGGQAGFRISFGQDFLDAVHQGLVPSQLGDAAAEKQLALTKNRRARAAVAAERHQLRRDEREREAARKQRKRDEKAKRDRDYFND